MFVSYRFGFSKSLYGSDGDFSLNNTLKLPENEKSFELFKAAIFKAVEENLPLMFQTFLAGQKLQKEFEAQAANEASLLAQPVLPVLEDEVEDPRADEWFQRYVRNFTAKEI